MTDARASQARASVLRILSLQLHGWVDTMDEMVDTDDLRPVLVINGQLAIPESELSFRFSRSSGPGGQHVQRSDTRVELLFDVSHSPSLSEEQRARILTRLGSRIDGQGVLRVVSAATRSQLENREEAVKRFRAVLASALRERKRRLATKPSAGAREARLAEKRVRSKRKETRGRVSHDE